MDLSIKLDDKNYLNIRVTVILENDGKFVLSKHSKGYFFFPGGRIKLGENSYDAAKREIEEETGISTEDFKYLGVVENFFGRENERVHEITFVYYLSIKQIINAEYGIFTFKKEEIRDLDLRPVNLKNMLLENKLESFNHLVIN